MMDTNYDRYVEINPCVQIKSFTSEDIYYINILYNKYRKKLEFKCTCGLKFNFQYRTKCKHILKIKETFNEEYLLEYEINNILLKMSDISIN
jgi:hypothetical protein